MQRLKISMKGLDAAANFVPYTFGGLNWQRFLYDYTLDADNTPYTQEILVGTTTSVTQVNIGNKKFIYPLPIKHVTVIDGVMRGFVKIKFKTDNASYKAYLEKIAIAVKAVDSDGTERTIETHSISVSLDTISTTGETKSIPFFFDIENQELQYNERIVIQITLYGKVASGGTGTYYLNCEINKEDLLVIVPIV
ncbi:unnamed protein product [marine sediment metagenome]|uniref:Uncharacterized protein n=1 Tax=marine sediment metagenome TaxID=412755 RepID=X1MUW4_9ZZZZ